MPRTPSHRSGSGSQERLVWPTHGSAVRSVSRPRIRSAIVSPARCEVVTPSPTYPPAHATPPPRPPPPRPPSTPPLPSPLRTTPTDGHQSRATPSTPLHPRAIDTSAHAGNRRTSDSRSDETVHSAISPL